MIPTLIIIITALAWLIKETDFMTVRLETTEYQKAQLAKRQAESVKVNTELITEDGLKLREVEVPENTISYRPSEFAPLDIPETSGTLNIVCKRG